MRKALKLFGPKDIEFIFMETVRISYLFYCSEFICIWRFQSSSNKFWAWMLNSGGFWIDAWDSRLHWLLCKNQLSDWSRRPSNHNYHWRLISIPRWTQFLLSFLNHSRKISSNQSRINTSFAIISIGIQNWNFCMLMIP